MNSHLFEHTQFEIIQSTGEIMRLLETERVPEMPLIFSDLFLGTWTPYQIAADFMEQLSIKYDEISGSEQATEKSSPAFYENKTLIPFSKYTQLGIDAESSGSLAEKKSLVYAEMIVAESLKVESCMYAVLFPHGDFLFSEENYSFLFHLVNLIRPEDKLIFLFYPGASTLSLFPQHYASDLNIKTAPVLPQKVNIPDSHLYLIPGIITENLSDFFSEVCASKLARINSTARMIPLECRLSILPNRKKAAEKLAAEPHLPLWLRAFSFYHVAGYFLNRQILQQYVSILMKMGSFDLALLYLDKLYKSSNSNTERAIYIAQIQGLRISKWDFHATCDQEVPLNIPEPLLNFLYISKAWGATLTGRIADAENYFEKVIHLIENDDLKNDEDFYLLNIFALFNYKKGFLDKAMTLEKKIEHALQAQTFCDYQMLFVNSINQARLYRSNNEYSSMQKYFQRAFDTANGVYTESDLIYFNLLMGYNYEQNKESQKAFIHYFRCALHWSGCKNSRLINKRLKSFVRYKADDGFSFETFFSDYLYSRLKNLGINNEVIQLKQNRIDESILLNKNTLVNSVAFGNEIATIISCSHQPQPKVVSEKSEQLQSLLDTCLSDFFSFDFNRSNYYVSNFCGEQMPNDEQAFLGYCFSHYVSAGYWQGKLIFRCSNEFNEYLEQAEIILNPGIKKIERKNGSTTVHYKRYLDAVSVTDEHHDALLSMFTNADSKLRVSQYLKTGNVGNALVILKNLTARKILYIKF